jgi:hypothetical protein
MYITCKRGLNKIPWVFISRIGNSKWCFYWELPIVPKTFGYEPIKDSHCKKGKN